MRDDIENIEKIIPDDREGFENPYESGVNYVYHKCRYCGKLPAKVGLALAQWYLTVFPGMCAYYLPTQSKFEEPQGRLYIKGDIKDEDIKHDMMFLTGAREAVEANRHYPNDLKDVDYVINRMKHVENKMQELIDNGIVYTI